MRKVTAFIILAAFMMNSFMPPSCAQMLMSKPGEMVALSPAFHPSVLSGVKIYGDNPFRFDFILDRGDEKEPLRSEDTSRLVKYFLASLTVPEKDMWVNLSPYEKDRIVPKAFGQSEMGRDLLAQDYFLKQITASLMFPEGDLGRKFWSEVYKQAQDKFGTTDIPVDTFNKVWITPAKAVVFEGKDTAYVVESKLKVMLESDYLAMSNSELPTRGHVAPFANVSSSTLPNEPAMDAKATQVANRMPNGHETLDIAKNIIRQIILPALEKEVNEGKVFAQLRQVYNSLILATWYKRKIKISINALPSELPLDMKATQGANRSQNNPMQFYVDQNKVAGVDILDREEGRKIWAQYVEAFKKGTYNFIKEETDPVSGGAVSRKYFSGGLNMDMSMLTISGDRAVLPAGVNRHARIVEVKIRPAQTLQQLANDILTEGAERFQRDDPRQWVIPPGVKFNRHGKKALDLKNIILSAVRDVLVNDNPEVALDQYAVGLFGSSTYLKDVQGNVYWDSVNDLEMYVIGPRNIHEDMGLLGKICDKVRAFGVEIGPNDLHILGYPVSRGSLENVVMYMYGNWSGGPYLRLSDGQPAGQRAFDVKKYGRFLLKSYSFRSEEIASILSDDIESRWNKLLKRVYLTALMRGDQVSSRRILGVILGKERVKDKREFIKQVTRLEFMWNESGLTRMVNRYVRESQDNAEQGQVEGDAERARLFRDGGVVVADQLQKGLVYDLPAPSKERILSRYSKVRVLENIVDEDLDRVTRGLMSSRAEGLEPIRVILVEGVKENVFGREGALLIYDSVSSKYLAAATLKIWEHKDVLYMKCVGLPGAFMQRAVTLLLLATRKSGRRVQWQSENMGNMFQGSVRAYRDMLGYLMDLSWGTPKDERLRAGILGGSANDDAFFFIEAAGKGAVDYSMRQAEDDQLVDMLTNNDNEIKDAALTMMATFNDPDRIHAVVTKVFERMNVDVGFNYYSGETAGRVILRDASTHAIGSMKFRKTLQGIEMDVDFHDFMQGRRLGPMLYQWWATQEIIRAEFKGLLMITHGTTYEQLSALKRAGLFNIHEAGINEMANFTYKGMFPDWDAMKNTGGIDLQQIPLDVMLKDGGMVFKADPAMLEKVRNAPGFIPVIVAVRPMETQLSAFLGIKD
ncbi:MAG: hypothetical protein HQL17_01430 [Candidatus Omnitrophica bacterium]|nr:hypothetical protein [Candidatus Omnitrophota bacterium]